MNIAMERVHVTYRTLAAKQVAIAELPGVAPRPINRFGWRPNAADKAHAGDQVFEDQTISLESPLGRVILPCAVLA
jgi:hypothetical protein